MSSPSESISSGVRYPTPHRKSPTAKRGLLREREGRYQSHFEHNETVAEQIIAVSKAALNGIRGSIADLNELRQRPRPPIPPVMDPETERYLRRHDESEPLPLGLQALRLSEIAAQQAAAELPE